jgi:hypothetical protein
MQRSETSNKMQQQDTEDYLFYAEKVLLKQFYVEAKPEQF